MVKMENSKLTGVQTNRIATWYPFWIMHQKLTHAESVGDQRWIDESLFSNFWW